MNVLGIDVGLEGAMVLLGSDGEPHYVADLPVAEGERHRVLDLPELVRMLEFCADSGAARVVLEKQSARPGQGVSSMFSLGRSYGALLGVLTALRMPVETISPLTWKRALRVPADKRGAALVASRLLPQVEPLLRGPRGALKDGRAEAALLAWWGVSKHG